MHKNYQFLKEDYKTTYSHAVLNFKDEKESYYTYIVQRMIKQKQYDAEPNTEH